MARKPLCLAGSLPSVQALKAVLLEHHHTVIITTYYYHWAFEGNMVVKDISLDGVVNEWLEQKWFVGARKVWCQRDLMTC